MRYDVGVAGRMKFTIMTNKNSQKERALEYADMKSAAQLMVRYVPGDDGGAAVRIFDDHDAQVAEAVFPANRIDEAHILWMESTELLRSRVGKKEPPEAIRAAAMKLFALFRGEKVSFRDAAAAPGGRRPTGDFVPNPGKRLEIEVDGVVYERLPVKTRIITTDDTDILPLIDEYVKPYVKPGDVIYVSEKALAITQGRVVDMSTVKPTPLARFLGSRVGNAYGTSDFRGFGHGTALAMQLFVEEAGLPRVLFAAAVSAVTRPLGIKGMFYRICGKRAKSIDCPMSFLVLEYAHSVKLAPNDTNGVARRIKRSTGCDAVILDANYRGAFSLGKSSRDISELFIGKLFADNPAGQSDEMTPFVIVRKK